MVGCSRNEAAQLFAKKQNENDSYRRPFSYRRLYQGAKTCPQLHAKYLNVKQ